MDETEDFLSRYSRQIVLPEIGGEGQKRLNNARVLVVGAGGLGTPVLQYLCAAGVGHITLYDHDVVERSNLQRQPLFRTDDLGKPKAEVAARALDGLNPDCTIDPRTKKLTGRNIKKAVESTHLTVEGSDNFETKFLVNDACVRAEIPVVIGGILRHRGHVLSVLPGDSPCYRCLFEGPPPEGKVPDCSEAGVLGPLAGTIGSIQGYEALKIILGFGNPFFDRLFEFRMDKGTARCIERFPNPECNVCSAGDD